MNIEKKYQPNEEEIKKAESIMNEDQKILSQEREETYKAGARDKQEAISQKKEKFEEFFKQMEKDGIEEGDWVLINTNLSNDFFNSKDTKYVLLAVDKERGVITLMKNKGESYDFSPTEKLLVTEIHDIKKTKPFGWDNSAKI